MKRDAYRILQAAETTIYLFAGFLIAAGAALLLVTALVEGGENLLKGR